MTYTVKSGDNLTAIASAHNTTVAELLRLNPQITNPSLIQVGQVITIKEGLKTYTVVSGDTMSGIGAKLGISWSQLAEHNGVRPPYIIHAGQKLEIPGTSAPAKPSFDMSIFNDVAKRGWIMDFYARLGWVLTSGYGIRVHPTTGAANTFHRGIDLGGKPQGEPIYSPVSGVVKYSSSYSGYGNLVAVEDKRGFIHIFAHMNTRLLGVGAKVNRGDQLGTNGATGDATGPHIHYQINVPGGNVTGLHAYCCPTIFDYTE